MTEKKTFYITTPIFYPNASPHMGHAYTTVLCDALARYHKLMGYNTYFLTGTDEHTEKVVQAAQKVGQEPDKYLEDIVGRFKELYKNLDISYDQFIRTSDKETHWPGVIEMWKRLETSGDIYKAEYAGLYCVGCESFLTEKELIDGKCPDHDVEPENVSEENYFFRLSKYTDAIKEVVVSNKIQIIPEIRKNEISALLDSGLQDVSFSRPKEKMTWGIPVPGDESQTMYIWMDALTNYITALGFGRGDENMDFWPGTHVIGKDILRFHTAFWPAMLLSAGLPLPKAVFIHGMITSGGRKMSKSLGNIIDPQELVNKYGTDATRYLLLKHVHPLDDTDITWERLDEWYTANLVNGLGNLVARVMKMAETYLDKGIEHPAVAEFPKEYTDSIVKFRMDQALDYVWKRVGELDEKITVTEPFKVIKVDEDKGKKLIIELAEELYLIVRMLNPFLPKTNEIVKKAILANKKPENLFKRLN